MTAPLAILIGWLLFGGSHLLFSWPPVSSRLTRRLGPAGFAVAYSAIATLSLALLGAVQWCFGAHGPSGVASASGPLLFFAVSGLGFLASMLMVAGLLGYPRSAVAQLARRLRSARAPSDAPLASPFGIFRATRHPFFLGLSLLMALHVLVADTLASQLFYLGFVVLTLAGITLQERKLRQRHPDLYPPANAAPPVPRSRPIWPGLALAAFVSALFVALHRPLWGPTNGAALALLIALFGNVALIRQLRSGRNTSR